MGQHWALAWRVTYRSDAGVITHLEAEAIEVADGGALLVYTSTRPTAPREGVPDLVLGPGNWLKVERV